MFNNEKKYLVLGHRGAPLKEIENTVLSFKKAIEDGADGVELDVRSTSDHILIVSHDNSLKRVYGSDISVESSTYAEVKKVAPGIATLGEVFDALGPVYYDIEIKADQPVDYKRENVTLLVKELEKRSELWPKIMVSSFNPLAMRQFASLTDNRFEMAVIYDGPPTSLPFFMRHGEGRFFFKCTFLKPKWDIATHEKSRKKKYEICPWTVDTEETLSEMLEIEPPFIITNDTEKIVRILREQGRR